MVLKSLLYYTSVLQ